MATGHFTDRGHQEMMSVYFQATTAPSQFLATLVNDTVVGTDDWSDVSGNVQTGTGYAAAVINRDATASGWPTGPALDSSEMMITSKTVTFTATAANWIATTAICLCADMSTDRLIAYTNITSVTVANGESLSAIFKPKLTKA